MHRALPLAALLLAATPAAALIQTLVPLKDAVKTEELIFVATVAEVKPDTPAMVLTRTDNLKGEAPFERMPVSLKGDKEAEKDKHADKLLKVVKKDLEMVVFASRKGKKYNAIAFFGGDWISLEGRVEKDGDKEVVRWAFLHGEPYMRRTFKGTTDELKEIVKGKKEAPAPDEKEKPGFADKPLSSAKPLAGTSDVAVGVIQLPFMGVIAALAAIFPAAFGGLALLMRRWVAALSTASLFSTLYFLYGWKPDLFAVGPLKTEGRLWLTGAALAALGGVWAAYRYRKARVENRADEYQPRFLDRVLTGSAALLCAGFLVWLVGIDRDPWRASPQLELIALGIPALASFAFLVDYWRRTKDAGAVPPVGVSTEQVALWAGCAGCLLAGVALVAPPIVVGDAVQNVKGVIETEDGTFQKPILSDKPAWVFAPAESGELFAAPCVVGNKVYCAAAHIAGFNTKFGRLYCVDLDTGKELWRTNDDDHEFKILFSSPVYADGKLYFGEGDHQSGACRMVCLDAESGKAVWKEPFHSDSHTESTPWVGGGKVVFGSGNDGLVCVDAATGQEEWRFPPKEGVEIDGKFVKGLHVDGNPAAADGLAFAGSGFCNTETHQTKAVFAVDLETGQLVWGKRVEDSVYGSPVVADGRLYVGTGNGTFSGDKEPIRGVLYCLDAKTGKDVWQKALPNSILCRPVVDRGQLYLGTRDGNCYAIQRKAGGVKWKRSLGSPVLAAPVLDGGDGHVATDVLYAAAEAGTIMAMSPGTGDVFWSTDLRALSGKPFAHVWSTPAVVRTLDGTGVRRRILVGSSLSAEANGSRHPHLYCFDERTAGGK